MNVGMFLDSAGSSEVIRLGSSVSRLEIPSFQVFLEPSLQLAYFQNGIRT